MDLKREDCLTTKKSFIAVVFLVLIAGFLFSCRSEPSLDLKAKVVYGPEGVAIENNDDFDWEDVEIKVNSKYEAELAILSNTSALQERCQFI